MKTRFTPQLALIITIILFLVLIIEINDAGAQTYNMKKYDSQSNPSNSEIFQINGLGNHSLGINYNLNAFTTYALHAKLHLIDAGDQAPYYGSLTNDRSVFQADALNIGSIKHWYYDGTIYYGVHQTTQTGISNVLNYFQDPVIIGNMSINGSYRDVSYFTAPTESSVMIFDFGINPPPNNPAPLKIYQDSLRVTGKAAMDEFELYHNHGMGYILVSDAHGNGTWTDPSSSNFNDGKWLINNDGDLYANPLRSHIGIGFPTSTDKILQKLHIVNGNILLSRSPETTLTDVNGSILFGDSLVDASCPLGKWGIGYYNHGLNFWKSNCIPSKSGKTINDNETYDYALFLSNDLTVGIGTNNTQGFKLAVKGKIICEELKVKTYANWPDYVLKNEYKLMPLKDIETYIDKNHRLPGIPSAEEISETGVNVGEMNAVLLKKVEELTKYIIEQQKQIDELKKKVENL